MEFNEYQLKAASYDLYKKTSDLKSAGFMEKTLGLAGEVGEVADKIKKVIRDEDGKLSDKNKKAIAKELGDVLWYLANVARYLDLPLTEVAKLNLEKLEDRKQRNLLHGEGDER